jgi:hypothetical protein
VTQCASQPTETSDEADEDDEENSEAPAGADAARADEGSLKEPSETPLRRWL